MQNILDDKEVWEEEVEGIEENSWEVEEEWPSIIRELYRNSSVSELEDEFINRLKN